MSMVEGYQESCAALEHTGANSIAEQSQLTKAEDLTSELALYQKYPKFFPRLASKGLYPDWARKAGLHPVVIFWMFVRALAGYDGYAKFQRKLAEEVFGRSDKTVLRWLTLGKQYGLFRSYVTNASEVTVYPASIAKVSAILEMKSWGYAVEIVLKDFKYADIRATEAEAAKLQKASKRAAEFAEKGESGKKPQLPSPKDLLTPPLRSSDVLVSKKPQRRTPDSLGRYHVSRKCVFVGEDFILYGASQSGIAKNLGIDERTVRRHLGDTYREERGLQPIPKKQVYQTQAEYSRMWDTPPVRGAASFIPRGLYRYRCKVYKPHTNLYLLNYRIIRPPKRREPTKPDPKATGFELANESLNEWGESPPSKIEHPGGLDRPKR